MSKSVSKEIEQTYSEWRGASLGSPSPLVIATAEQKALLSKYGCIEITLNYPRTSGFVKMVSRKQKQMYLKIWDVIKCACGIPLESKCVFEYCKSGHVHLHGYLIPSVENYYVLGYIADIVKTYVNMLPKKYSIYNDKCMFSEFLRYRSPSICVQYNKSDVRFNEWLNYLNKQQ